MAIPKDRLELSLLRYQVNMLQVGGVELRKIEHLTCLTNSGQDMPSAYGRIVSRVCDVIDWRALEVL